jgi:molybdenum cofactor cytidylyltransferase
LIAAIVLAAGKSERMGQPKALLRFRGRTFLENILLSIGGSSIRHTVVVVGRHRAEIQSAIPETPMVFNPNYEQGMTTSVQAGIRALPTGVSAAVIFLVDHPSIDEATIEKLIANVRQGCIVLPTHEGRRGHPVVFSATLFPEILALDADCGLNTVVRADPGRVLEVSVESPEVLRDIDTPEQFRALTGGGE